VDNLKGKNFVVDAILDLSHTCSVLVLLVVSLIVRIATSTPLEKSSKGNVIHPSKTAYLSIIGAFLRGLVLFVQPSDFVSFIFMLKPQTIRNGGL